jgi:hypothetical protein
LKKLNINCHCRDECYACLVEAVGVTGDVNKVEQLLHTITSKEVHKASVGMMSYETFLRICIDAQAWDKAIRGYLDMEMAGVKASKSANYYYVLATLRVGSKSEAIQVLKKFIDGEHQLGDEIYMVALRLFFPALVRENQSLHSCVQAIRMHIIQRLELLDKSSSVYNDRINLIRALQLANDEQIREPNIALSLDDIELKRQQAWRAALVNLLSTDNETLFKNGTHNLHKEESTLQIDL